MAKKTVASLQTSSKRLSKAIKMVKSPKTGAYTFVESIMAPEEDRWITLRVAASTIKTINKNGISAVLKKAQAEGFIK
jgi:hypothetical protein